MHGAQDTVSVAQTGARMRYAVPRILHEAGRLRTLFTDAYARKWLRRTCGVLPEALLPRDLRKLLGRVPHGIPEQSIVAFDAFGAQFSARYRLARTPAQRAAVNVWAGETFGRRVADRGMEGADAIYAFNTAALEIFEAAARCGIRRVLEQTIAPYATEFELLAAARERFPEWERPEALSAAEAQLIERERREWALADRIVCGSAFVREAIGKHDPAAAAKCVVVPYGIESLDPVPRRAPHGGPLRVLTVGSVCLRKGHACIAEAARRLAGSATVRLVGPLQVPSAVAQQLASVTELVGSVPHSELAEHYAWADVFLLPSLCEGSATVTYEALCAGLPVVCTPNAGSIVRDGVDGIVVPCGDVSALCAALTGPLADFDRRRAMAENARSSGFSRDLAAYARDLLRAIDGEPGVPLAAFAP